ncbi:MAG: C4-type zinc ribbon domain-containing protein [Desulfobacterales bacterium]|nr:C4-type zinc ribbon domain-containing protein [Desulfobacterales bacterium]
MKQKGHGPLRIQKLKDELDAVQSRFQKDRETLDGLKKERRKIELEIQDLENRIQKSTIKLSNIKSNKEYGAALKEIEEAKKAKFIIEDKVIQAMEEIEEMERTTDEYEKLEPEALANFERGKEEIERELLGLEQELEILQKKRNKMINTIDKEVLKRYLFLKDRKGGRAIGSVIAGVCQTCHMEIPPQKFNELIRCDSLMACPHCNRIVYWGEDKHFL